MTEGVDYSYGRPDPAKLAAAGKHFACRYLTVVNAVTAKKLLTKAEADALIAAGLAIVSNWEYAAGDARGGHDAGVKYAKLADEQHRAAGGPPDRPIYFSVDWDASPADLTGPIRAYFQGIASVLGVDRTGAYGGIRTIDYLFDHGLITWGWQTYAWSSGKWDSRAHIQQYDNGVTVAKADCDLDRATTIDYGQWGVDDMPTADEIAKAVWDADYIPAPRPPVADDDFGDPAKPTEGNKMWRAKNDLRDITEQGRENAAAIKDLAAKVDDILAAVKAGIVVNAQVDLTPAAIAAVADATADEIHADPERDGV